MDGVEWLLAILIFILAGLFALLIGAAVDDHYAFEAMTTPTPINTALSQEIGSRVFIVGTVEKFDKTEMEHWIMFIPIMMPCGKSSCMILMPIPMTDVDYVYKITDSTGSIPVKFESEQTIGSTAGFKGHIKKAKGAGTKYVG